MIFINHKTCIKCSKQVMPVYNITFCCNIRYEFKNDGSYLDYIEEPSLKVKFAIYLPKISGCSLIFLQKADDSYWLYLCSKTNELLCYDNLVDLKIPFDFSTLDNTLCMRYIKNIDLF